MINNEKFDNFRIELNIVQIGHTLLLSTKHRRSKTRGQIRRGHLILLTMRGHRIQMLHEQLDCFQVKRRQRIEQFVDLGESLGQILFATRHQELLIKRERHERLLQMDEIVFESARDCTCVLDFVCRMLLMMLIMLRMMNAVQIGVRGRVILNSQACLVWRVVSGRFGHAVVLRGAEKVQRGKRGRMRQHGYIGRLEHGRNEGGADRMQGIMACALIGVSIVGFFDAKK